ncbi:MAG: helix-turn-helix transcriptional regulator [Candidatus Krumholzibacteriota bacterium]|nr:helix-turn-helix transcriptional regulator [Candidatus Krumholzibacteriota bacterium]
MIAERGVHALTIRTLATRVGVSRSALYRHFRNKGALLSAIAADGFRRLESRLAAVDAAGTDPLDRLGQLFEAFVLFAVEDPSMYRLMFAEETNREASTALRDAAAAAIAHPIKTIEECIREGSLRPENPLALVRHVWVEAHGLSMLLIDGQLRSTGGAAVHAVLAGDDDRDAIDPADLARSTARLLLDGMRA